MPCAFAHVPLPPTRRRPLRSAPSRLAQVLEADGSNPKALYRRAQAWLATADFTEAELDIRRGLAEVGLGF